MGRLDLADGDLIVRLESLILSQETLMQTKDGMIARLETRVSALEKSFSEAGIWALRERLDRVEEESSGIASKLTSLRSVL